MRRRTWITKNDLACDRIDLIRWYARWIATGETNCLRIGRAANSPGPVDSISLFLVGGHFDQTRFNHDLFGRFVDLGQQLSNVVDVAAGLPKEKRVGAFVYLDGLFG